MPYDQFPALDVRIADGIATVTLNRPGDLNAFTGDLHRACELVWPVLADDRAVKAIVLTGAGKAFSAGGDVGQMAERHGTAEGRLHALGIGAGVRRLVHGMIDCNKPVVAAINGDAIGLGATVALLCDVTVMARGARIGDPHVKVGLVAGDGGAVIWPALVGPHRAKELLMSGRLIDGAEAARIGLVNHVVDDGEAVRKATQLAAEFARNPVWAVQWTKASVNRLIRDQVNLILDASIAWETASMLTDDHREAAVSFLEKRRPDFTGS